MEVEHCSVGVLGDPSEDLVVGVVPDASGLLVESLDHDPLDHQTLEDEDGLEDPIQGDLDQGVEFGAVLAADGEVHVAVGAVDGGDQAVEGAEKETANAGKISRVFPPLLRTLVAPCGSCLPASSCSL